MDKIQSWDEAQNTVTKWKSEECKAVFTNGCFDILHAGHVSYLKKAKALGDKKANSYISTLNKRKQDQIKLNKQLNK